MIQSLTPKAFSFEDSRSPDPRASDEVRDLIERYPNLSEIELVRLINLYRELSSLNMALMLSDENLAPKLDGFSREHRSKIRTPFHQYAALLGYALIGIAVFAWAIAAAQ